MRPATPPATRFWPKVDKTSPSGCWAWTGSKCRNGYGHFRIGRGSPLMAHRVAWSLTNGAVPEGAQIRHNCGLRGCVNPAHLEARKNSGGSAPRSAGSL